MNLHILNADKYAIKLKATLQASGKLGFTDTTRNELGLTQKSYIYIAKDDDTDNLYLIVSDTPDSKAFRVHKSGSYYNVPTKGLFDELGYDYKSVTQRKRSLMQPILYNDTIKSITPYRYGTHNFIAGIKQSERPLLARVYIIRYTRLGGIQDAVFQTDFSGSKVSVGLRYAPTYGYGASAFQAASAEEKRALL